MSARRSYLLDGQRVAKARLGLPREGGRPISQQDLADRLEINRVTLARIEGGVAPVSLELLERLSRELGRSREWLLGEPDVIDEFERARALMASSLTSFSEALDLLNARLGDAAPAAEREAAA